MKNSLRLLSRQYYEKEYPNVLTKFLRSVLSSKFHEIKRPSLSNGYDVRLLLK